MLKVDDHVRDRQRKPLPRVLARRHARASSSGRRMRRDDRPRPPGNSRSASSIACIGSPSPMSPVDRRCPRSGAARATVVQAVLRLAARLVLVRDPVLELGVERRAHDPHLVPSPPRERCAISRRERLPDQRLVRHDQDSLSRSPRPPAAGPSIFAPAARSASSAKQPDRHADARRRRPPPAPPPS